MAELQILSLETTTPQLRAPASGVSYSAPRALDITPETLTGSAATSSLSIAQTWNTSGTPTAIDLNVTDTASNASSLLMNLRVGGTSRFSVTKAGRATFDNFCLADRFVFKSDITQGIIPSGGLLYLDSTSGTAFRRTSDFAFATLAIDAANTLAQRNGVNAQAFRMYETFTDASNYSRLDVDYSGGQWRIIPSGAGTGDANRGLLLGPNGQGAVIFQTNNTPRWTIGATTGHLIASADNTYDIGASGANRPRNLFLSGNITTSGGLTLAAAGAIDWPTRASISANATDVVRILGSTTGGALQLVEMTAPAAPGTNNVRIYAEDNGSGKTRLMALFATGVAQQLAVEP